MEHKFKIFSDPSHLFFVFYLDWVICTPSAYPHLSYDGDSHPPGPSLVHDHRPDDGRVASHAYRSHDCIDDVAMENAEVERVCANHHAGACPDRAHDYGPDACYSPGYVPEQNGPLSPAYSRGPFLDCVLDPGRDYDHEKALEYPTPN